MREHFRCDDSIEAFWKLPDERRRSIWGDPLTFAGCRDNKIDQREAGPIEPRAAGLPVGALLQKTREGWCSA